MHQEFRATHFGFGIPQNLIARGISDLGKVGMVPHRNSGTGVILRKKGVIATDAFEIELVDQGSKDSNWDVEDGKVILRCTQPKDTAQLLRELGFHNPSEGLFSHARHEIPFIHLIEANATPTKWHIGIHFDEAVPLCTDFQRDYPHTAKRANRAISKARGRQFCCYEGKELDGLNIEVTVDSRFCNH